MATASLPAPGNPAAAVHPLRNRNFLTWWVGATASLLGDQFYIVALPWVVLQLTGSGVAMGAVAMTAGVPRAVLMLFGGAVTDRNSPRQLLIRTACARTVLVGAIGILVWAHILQLWHLYILAFAFGLVDAFALPASAPLMRSLVEPQQLPAANSTWQSTALITGIVAPAPAGFIMKALGAAWAFFIDAFSFLFIIAALWKLPEPAVARPAGPKPSVWKSIGEGLAYVGSDVPLRTLLLLTSVLNFCLSGPFSVGLAYMAKARFGSPASFGVWISSVAGGALAGILLAGALKVTRLGVALLGITTALGAIMTGIGYLPGLWPVAGLLAISGGLSGFINVQFQAWFQRRVDRAVLGRVASVILFTNLGLAPLSMAAAGVAVEWSAQGMFVIAGAAVVTVSAFAVTQQRLRELA